MTGEGVEDAVFPSILLSKHDTMTEVSGIGYIVHLQTVNILLREPQKTWLENLQSAMRGPRFTFRHAGIPSERERGEGVTFQSLRQRPPPKSIFSSNPCPKYEDSHV